jgi:predicted permease
MLQDIRQALRSLIKRPSSAVLTVVVFGLAIGANATVFSVFNGFFLRPMPFPDDGLVMIYGSAPKLGVDDGGTDVAGFLEWRKAPALEAAAVFTTSSRALQGEQQAEEISVTRATPSLLAMLGVAPALGSGFTEDHAVPGSDRLVLLSHRLWTTRFGARADAVGQDVRLDENLFRIAGVMPEGFGFPDRDTDAWVPFAYRVAAPDDDDGFESYTQGVGRLRPGSTLQGLNAELRTITRGMLEQSRPDPDAFIEATGWTTRAVPLREYVIGELRPRLLVLQGLVLAVLLIACANVANLQLARVTARRKELAVRAALGAKRRRLARLLVLESVLLAMAGGCVGLLLAYGGIELVRVLGLERADEGFELTLDAVVLVVTMSVALIAALLSTLVPLFELVREDFARAVQESGRANTGGVATRRWRSALVVVQLAAGVALLTGAGLLTKTFYGLQAQGPGFRAAGVWSAGVKLPNTRYEDDAVRTRFFQQAIAELRSLPGVDAAGFTTMLPFTSTDWGATIDVEGAEPLDGSVVQAAQLHSIDEGYFAALGIPVVFGRSFTASESERVVIVDESFARTYWPDGGALGARLRNSGDGSTDWYTIVGVVPHVKHDSFTGEEFENTVYWHYLQRAVPPSTGMFVLRTALPVESLTSAAQAMMARVDPTVALDDVVPMETRVADALGPQRAPMVLTLVFAAIAVALAVIGVYGVLAWAVARRVGEIGVRMALGARSADVLRMVMKQGARMIAAGLVLGTAGALALGRVLASQIPEVAAADPVVLAAAVLSLAAAAVLASWLPARRAARVDPLQALRQD